MRKLTDEGRGGYAHHMLKEIHEQPQVLGDTLAGRLHGDRAARELGLDEATARGIRRVELVACGTSWHAALIGRRLIEDVLGIPTTAEIASEYRDWPSRPQEGTLVLTITQSGETADTLAALRAAKKVGHRVGAICNVEGSTIAREADGVLYTKAGTEVSIASTKAFTGQVAAMYLLTLGLGRLRGGLDASRERRLVEGLEQAPERMGEVLASAGALAQQIAEELRQAQNFFYLGRAYGYPVALEGALKLKETSYIHAEGYPSGEFRHGPIALITGGVPVVAVACGPSVRERMLGNLQEIRAKGGHVIAVGAQGDRELAGVAHRLFSVPTVDEELLPLFAAVPMQLLAYRIAVSRGREVDQPRNLTKSVTGD